ncbi:MAG: N-acetyltransferase [Bacteroidales bacterium]|jgi:GNAT superfamily N-acetyltransferase|nr:N-acetyltransferase [Bacteroidales bacterium]MBR3455348.1 N-acetyltransferase [Bacteroidaceae bacterium]MBR4239919.1 N-acetyltransferase [Prevotella sp.]MBR4698849.1 N-acetyltransferase [Prevotella sp.]
MPTVEIKKVSSRRDLKKFVEFHYDLYKGNKYDAPNLFSDDMNTLDEQKNAAFEFCEAEYYIAYKDGKVAGRVAAIINHHANEKWQRKSVRFGWIDFIDDTEVSEALMKAVEDYGRKKGMTEVIGPLGFTDMDPEGMLTYGFEELGTMATLYNYPYYPKHIERLGGYVKDNDYVEYKVYVPDKIPEKMVKISEMIMKRYNLHVRTTTKKEVFEEGMGQKIFDVINETFGHLYGYSTLSENQIKQYVDMYFPMIDLDLVPIIEDWSTEEHKVVGVGITLPSLTLALQKCWRGRLYPFGWWHILRALKMHKAPCADLLLIGVLPEYRKKGANALLFYHLIPFYQKYGFAWGETHVEMETNDKVQSQWMYFEHEQHKRRRCYKKVIG